MLATCPIAVCTACGTPIPNRPRRAHRPESCDCGAATRPGVVLDPFLGAGTTALVAKTHGRDWVGIELNPNYITLAQHRLNNIGTEANKAT